MTTADFEKWLADKPKSIQRCARKYPPGWYLVKKNAPYGISCPGTKVELRSYYNCGDVGVIVYSNEKLPAAIAHESELAIAYGKTAEETKKIHESDVSVQVNPKWLEFKVSILINKN